MREHRAVLYTANGYVTQARLRVCLVHNSMVFANQQGLYACLNVISTFHGKGLLLRKTRALSLSLTIIDLVLFGKIGGPVVKNLV